MSETLIQGEETLKLLPCPFCGGRAGFEQVESKARPGTIAWSVGCMNIDVDCIGYQMMATFSRKVEAWQAWNTRAPTEAITQQRRPGRRTYKVSR